MPLHSSSSPAMASQGVLINNSVVQATVECAAEDGGRWHSCIPHGEQTLQ